jgi:hypothetical protein
MPPLVYPKCTHHGPLGFAAKIGVCDSWNGRYPAMKMIEDPKQDECFRIAPVVLAPSWSRANLLTWHCLGWPAEPGRLSQDRLGNTYYNSQGNPWQHSMRMHVAVPGLDGQGQGVKSKGWESAFRSCTGCHTTGLRSKTSGITCAELKMHVYT